MMPTQPAFARESLTRLCLPLHAVYTLCTRGHAGTYNTKLLADEAARLVLANDPKDPFYMYLAFMAVHDGCGEPSNTPFFNLGKQAPMATVELYNTTVLDTYKVAGAMYTELDAGIQTVSIGS